MIHTAENMYILHIKDRLEGGGGFRNKSLHNRGSDIIPGE